jgi:hypothetical protein
VIAAVRPTSWDLPLYLHVAGAMTLVGAASTTLVLAIAGVRRPDARVLAQGAFLCLLAALPAWIVMRVGAAWTYSKEFGGYPGHSDPGWVSIGYAAADAGLIILLVAVGIAYTWFRQLRSWAPQVLSAVTAVYLALLAVAWLAMTGKWG